MKIYVSPKFEVVFAYSEDVLDGSGDVGFKHLGDWGDTWEGGEFNG